MFHLEIITKKRYKIMFCDKQIVFHTILYLKVNQTEGVWYVLGPSLDTSWTLCSVLSLVHMCVIWAVKSFFSAETN